MFITKEAINTQMGVEVDAVTLSTAQMMIEAWVGKSDADVTDAGDRSTLGRAVAFQAVYINGKASDILEQIAVKKMTVGATNTEFDTSLFSPYMSPWAVMTCQRLSWRGTRSVHTGPIVDRVPVTTDWRRD